MLFLFLEESGAFCVGETLLHSLAVSSRDDFLFSGKEDKLFMQGVYSHGTRPE
jgi:hypothetical protein